ncbi:hypothetical protein CBOM_03483 [Ceraceosorus bombacis]|uniref:Uncharacterized protein n=1 Tax=Ceraceosorus bombacis TaxID=401625 RepID=A0A0N7LAT0_9BASI|nr:hypothetical protein CBOM_03483 [Ceraceosorus bombacis]
MLTFGLLSTLCALSDIGDVSMPSPFSSHCPSQALSVGPQRRLHSAPSLQVVPGAKSTLAKEYSSVSLLGHWWGNRDIAATSQNAVHSADVISGIA